MNESFHIADLVVKKIKGTITPVEQQELEHWIGEDPEHLSVYNRATDPKKQLDKLAVYGMFNKERVWANLEGELFKTKTIKFTPQKFLRVAAAILLPLLIGGGFAYWYLNQPSADRIAEIDAEVKPGSQKAVLILSNGEVVELDNQASGATLYEGDASIQNENNRIRYSSDERETGSRRKIFNELRTPRGGGYHLQLADGTNVWLNAGSSLKYPVSFHDSTRQVMLDGEAYFEVSHDGSPFIVTAGNMNTRVLGTSFNVSAYSDDAAIVTTLVEGKVSVELVNHAGSDQGRTILAPDEQATFTLSTAEISVARVNSSSYISWMKGKMEFHNESLETVMKRLARWYDFDYRFENSEAKEFHFSARLDNGESISAILEMLEMTTDVKFAYKENTIVVF